MGKIAVLSFLMGDCQQGFQQVRLEIRDDNQGLLGQFIGQLPPAPHIPELYTTWQSRYRLIGFRGMGKIAVLSFLMGDCQQGFQQVRLEIRDDNQRLLEAFIGKLPPAPHIPELYTTWQSRYRLMGSRVRLDPPLAQITNFSRSDLEVDSNALKQQLNDWLKSPEFFSVIRGLMKVTQPDEEVRVIIQTEDSHLRRLPWHLWEFFDDYLNAEVALSSFVCQRINSPKTRNKVRILAIIGDSTGINLERDQRELEEKLPEAEIVFVREPEKEKVFDAIWDWRGWDILFFAGHSISAPDATTGKLFIGGGKSLEIGDLKLTLRKAIARGLKLAIFNSCDGLGIAKQLADLNMPQVIVMREPVPDMVAQEFLKYFLEAFARGESLYLAVREARERLESVEREFPCATWLPVICQNPAEKPVSWQELVGRKSTTNQKSDEQQEQNTNQDDNPPVWKTIADQGLSIAKQGAKAWMGFKVINAGFNLLQNTLTQRSETEENDGTPTE